MDGIFPHRWRDGDGWPDAWAWGNDSLSRRDASELEALWRCERSGEMSWSWESGGWRCA